jgi:prepilin-type N-terminal cleavage/methylation domain-containing protein
MDRSLGSGVSTKAGMNLGRTKMKNQRGFTIMELLMVIALTGIITAAITTTVFQVYNINTRTANHMVAVSQVQQAGKLVSQDVLQSQTVDPDNDPGTPELEVFTLSWTDWATAYVHKVVYTLVDMSSGEWKILWREHYVKEDSSFELDSTTSVAEYIDPDQTSLAPEDGAWVFTVTARVGDESEQRIYKIQPRPGS